MRVVRRLLVLVLVLVSVGVGARAAYACSCAGPPDLRSAVTEAEVAFRGEVVRAGRDNAYEVRVHGLIKGSLPSVVTVEAEDPQSSSCGLTLSPGPLLYAGDRDLHIAQCASYWTGDGVTQALATSGVQATGSPGPAPPAEDAFPLWPVAVGLGVLVLGALALRRKKPMPRDDVAEGSYGGGS